MISKSTIKYIQSLQDKKNRDVHNVFIAEGPKVVKELLEQNIFECEAIYYTKKWAFVNTFNDNNTILIEEYELEKISALSGSNQVLAIFKKSKIKEDSNFKNKITLVLDDIQDPGNLGTIIRTADWFGVQNIICSVATADCYNSKVVQSTMASLGRVNITYTDLLIFFQKNKTIKKYVTVFDGKNVKELGKIKEGFLLMGNESKGLSDKLIQMAEEKITIQKIGNAESLNVALATGIILHSIA